MRNFNSVLLLPFIFSLMTLGTADKPSEKTILSETANTPLLPAPVTLYDQPFTGLAPNGIAGNTVSGCDGNTANGVSSFGTAPNGVTIGTPPVALTDECDYVKVISGELRARDTNGGEICVTTSTIDISGYEANASLRIGSSAGTFEGDDFVRVRFIVDGSIVSNQQFFGGLPAAGTTLTYPFVGTFTGLEMAMQICFRNGEAGGVGGDGEIYFVDDILVEGEPCSDIDPLSITVPDDLPALGLQVCGSAVTVNIAAPDLADGSYEFSYDLTDTGGASSGTATVAISSGAGSFIVNPVAVGLANIEITQVELISTGCTQTPAATVDVDFEVKTGVEVTIDPLDGVVLCEGVDFVFQADFSPIAATITDYSWSVTGGASTGTFDLNNSPGAQTVEFTPAVGAPATATISLTVTDSDGCTATDDVSISINDAIDADINELSQDLCIDGSFPLSAAVTGGAGPGNYIYLWEASIEGSSVDGTYFTDGGENDDTPTFDIPGAFEGNYEDGDQVLIELTVSDVAGCILLPPVSITLILREDPDAEVNAATPTMVCSGETFSINVDNPNGFGDLYRWTASYGATTGGAYVGTPIEVVGFGNDITETLTNESGLPVTVTYTITPVNTINDGPPPATDECIGTAITYDIVIKPQPEITCPSNFSVNTDNNLTGDCSADATWTHPTPAAACEPVTLTMSLDGGTPAPVTPGASITQAFTGKGVHTVAYTATDGNSNVETCSFEITVVDNENPVITCAAGSPFTRNTDPGQCDYKVQGTEFDATFTDNCPMGSISNDYNSLSTLDGEIFPKGTTTVTWTATDMAGNSVMCSIDITVEDHENPVIACAIGSPFTRNTDPGVCNYTVVAGEFDPVTTTDNCPMFTVENDLNGMASLAGAVLPKGTTTIVWKITDMSGNTATCSIEVTVEDHEDPVITCAAGTPFTKNTDPGECNYTTIGSEFDPVSFGDNCPMAVISNDFAPGISLAGVDFPKGTTTVKWTVTDMSGNTATCTIDITVEDNEPPMITCPAGSPFTRVTNPGVCTYTVQGTEFDATFMDNCPMATLTNDFNGSGSLAGAELPKGTTTIEWTVTDMMGNTDVCTIEVTVNDEEIPVIDSDELLQDISTTTSSDEMPYAPGCAINTPHDCTALVEWTHPTFEDNCPLMGGMTMLMYELTGATTLGPQSVMDFSGTTTAVQEFQLGVTTVTYTGKDMSGNMAVMKSFTVTVTDDEAPVVTNGTCPPDVILPAVTNTCNNQHFFIRPTFGDNCSAVTIMVTADNPTVVISEIIPASGIYTGIFPVGVTTVTIKATDASNNMFIHTFTVTIQDLQVPSITCPANIVQANDPGFCGADVNFIVQASDNCPGVTFVCTIPGNPDPIPVLSGDFFPVGLTTVTCKATDAGGLMASCSFDIRVNDVEAPDAVCQDVTVQLDATGQVTIPASDLDGGSTDNCDMDLTFTVDGQPTVTFDCADAYASPVAVTLTVQDDPQLVINTSTCTSQVTVLDVTAPTFDCPLDISIECSDSQDPLNTGEPSAVMDACDADPSVDYSDVSDQGSDPEDCSYYNYTITRIWTVTDDFNNSSTCEQAITVSDNTAPTFVCAADITIECDESTDPSNTGMPTDVLDNCDSDPDVSYSDVSTQDADATPGTCDDYSYTITRTWTFTDVCGNTATCVQVITVEDTTAPTFECPANLTVQCDESTDPEDTGKPTNVVDNCDSNPQVTFSDVSTQNADMTSGTCDDYSYTITRTWTFTDVCGNTSTCTQVITVEDTTAPTFDCPSDITLECDADLSPMGAAGAPANIVDNCDGGTATFVDVSTQDADATPGTCDDNSYIITRTWTVTDVCGNASTCIQMITVEDTTPPVFLAACDSKVFDFTTTNDGADCPADAGISISIGDMLTPLDNWTVGGVEILGLLGCLEDNCANPEYLKIEVANIEIDDSALPCKRTITASFRISDPCDNVQPILLVCIFNISDDTPPTFTVPNDIMIFVDQDCDYDAGVIFTGDVTDEADNCAPGVLEATFTDDVNPGSCVGETIITRTWVLEDGCGNSTTQVQTITVKDNIPPVLQNVAQDFQVQCDGAGNLPGLNSWLNNHGFAIATDNCSTVTWTNDFTGLSDLCGATGAATVTFTATDDCGNSVSTTATFTIFDNLPPTITTQAQNLTIACDGMGNVGQIQTWLDSQGGAAATDQCSGSNLSWTNNYMGIVAACAGTGMTSVVFTVTDDCGNFSTTTATLTIVDNDPPVLQTPAIDVVVECNGAGNAAALNNWLNNNGFAVATDDCSSLVWTNDFAGLSDGCASTGTTTVIFTATDICGNSTSTTASFTIVDNTAPSISCPAAITIECTASLDPDVNTSLGKATGTDICGGVTITFNDFEIPSGVCEQNKTVVREWKATDDCGNMSTCFQIITVVDTTPPDILCPADITIECTESTDPINTGMATGIDACGGVVITSSDAITPGSCPQTYTITRTWTATDDCGNASTCDQIIKVQDTKPPVITTDPASETVECDGTDMQSAIDDWLNGQAGGTADDECGIVTWSYMIDSDTRPTACGNTGVVTATFTATDECGNSTSATATFTIEDTTPPTVDIIGDQMVMLCQFEVYVDLGATASFDICDNAVPTVNTDNPVNTAVPGTYTVTYTTSDDCGNEGSATRTVVVKPLPVGEDPMHNICDGEQLDLDLQTTISNNVESTFIWTLTGPNPEVVGAPASGNTDHITSAGAVINNSPNQQVITYTVVPTSVEGPCLGAAYTVTILINPNPDAVTSAPANPTQFCEGSQVNLVGDGVGGMAPYTHTWTIVAESANIDGKFIVGGNETDGPVSEQSPAITAYLDGVASGTVTVQHFVVDNKGCMSETDQLVLTFIDGPEPNPIQGQNMPCINATETYSVTQVPGNTYMWTLSSGGGIISGNTGPSINIQWGATPGGVHTITVKETSANGCMTTNTIEVTIKTITANFDASATGLDVDFMDTSTGDPIVWIWDFGDGDGSSDQNPTHTYATDGQYQVCLTVIGACGSDQYCELITVSQQNCDQIALVAGLNLISTDVIPMNAAPASVFADLVTAGILVNVIGIDATGATRIYDPFQPLFSTLTQIEPGYGYLVRVTQAATLEICGTPIDPNLRVPLVAGLNIVGYVPQTPATPADYFTNLISANNLVLVVGIENGATKIYNPFGNPIFNTLTQVKNGFGYLVRVISNVPGGGWFTSDGGDIPQDKFGNYATDNFTFVAGHSNLPSQFTGQEVLVVGANGKVYGSMEIRENGLLMTRPIFGDDSTVPELTGIPQNEKLYFEFQGQRIDVGYQFKGQKELNVLNIDFDLESIVNKTGEPVNILNNWKVFPNPFNGRVTVQFDLQRTEEDVALSVLNAEGKVVRVLAQMKTLAPGKHTYFWEPEGNASPGQYSIILRAGDQIIKTEMVVKID